MIRRHPLLSLLALVLLILAALAWQNRVHLQAFPGIIGAYTAKEYCSCRYVANYPAAYCETYVSQYIPISDFLDDASNKRVSARGFGSTQSAQWLSAREGCQLLPQPTELP